jgi:ubiquinone/menaquinone biosynthesis C-methylase UbiE
MNRQQRNSLPDFRPALFSHLRRAHLWLTRGAVFVFLVCGVAAFGQQTSLPRATTARPLNERVADYERAERESWQKPDEIVKALELKNGDVVADIGAGTGYFSRRFAKAVAPAGKVYAVDIAADILEFLKKDSEKQNLNNIVLVLSKEDDPMLPENSVDLAFFSDTTHHIANRANFYRKMRPGLKKGGLMAIVDFPPDASVHPHKAEELVPRSQVIAEAEEAGFKLRKEFKFLPRQYFLVFEKTDQEHQTNQTIPK